MRAAGCLLSFLLPGLFLPVPSAHGEGLSQAGLSPQAGPLAGQPPYDPVLASAEETLLSTVEKFGAEHPHVAAASSCLAALYQSQGEREKAQLYYQQALKINQAAFGENHPRAIANVMSIEKLLREPAGQSRSPMKPPAGKVPEDPARYLLQADPYRDDWARAGQTAPLTRFASSGGGQGQEESWWEVDFSFETGYRQDDVNFTISVPGGQNPNIISELSWQDIESFQTKGELWFLAKPFAAVRAAVDYGWIYNGQVQDSDFLGNNRTAEFSRSLSAADDGHVADLSLGLGYPWEPELNGYNFRLVPLAGYSYHEQKLSMTNGTQILSAFGFSVPLGSFNNLDSQYLPRWKGPWIGLDVELGFMEKWWFFAGTQYHWADLRADANWNLRADFSHPKSFRHEADGQGWVSALGLGYAPWKDWIIRFELDIQNWSTDPGVITFFLADGTTTKQPLNAVDWDSYAISLGVEVRF